MNLHLGLNKYRIPLKLNILFTRLKVVEQVV